MYEILQNGTYVSNTNSQYYSLELFKSGNVFLSVAGNNGASAIYDKNLNFISYVASEPMYLEAGSYVVNTKYSSPNLAALSVYIPQQAKSSDLVDLSTGSYIGSTWNHYYDLAISTSKNVLIDVYGDNGRSAVYDQALNFVADITSAPIHLDAGSYIVHAAYSSKNQAGLTINIPIDPIASINEIFNGTVGNESFTGGTGDDTINGGDGIDTATFSLQKANYSISKVDSGFRVEANFGNDGSDALSNIERLQFADKKIALDLTPDGNAGKALEFIGMMAHNLVNTPTVVGTILSIFDQGKSMKEVCQLAIDVGLTGQLAGSTSNLDLAKLVFRNVVGSEASASNAANLASFIQGSGGSMTQADFLTAVAQLDLNNQHIGLVGLQNTGVEYIV
jgi:hypothetical protein